MTLVNWTGLTVNGLVAFILPMYLVLRSLQVRHLMTSTVQDHQDEVQLVRLAAPQPYGSSSGTSPASEVFELLSPNAGSYGDTFPNNVSPRTPASVSRQSSADPQQEDPSLQDSSVQPLPRSLEFLRFPLVVLMIVCFCVIIGGTIFLDIYMGVQPEERRLLG